MYLDWEAFGRDIRRRREAQCETVREAAEHVGMASATFSRAERGLPVDAENFLLLCRNYLDDCDPRLYYRRDRS